MKVRIERACPGNQLLSGSRWSLWHVDCPSNDYSSGVCREAEVDVAGFRSLVECLHCGQMAWLTHAKMCHDEATVGCRAGMDGECNWKHCPQERDGEPAATGRHCPLDKREELE